MAYQTVQYPTTMYQVSRPMMAPVQYIPATSLPTSYVHPSVPVMRQQVFLQPGAVRPAMFHVLPQQQQLMQPMQPYSQAPVSLPVAMPQQQHVLTRPMPVPQQMAMLPAQHVVQQPPQRTRTPAASSYQIAQKRMRYAAVLPHALLASRAQQVRLHCLPDALMTLTMPPTGQCHGAAASNAAAKGPPRPCLPHQILRRTPWLACAW